MSQYLLSVYQPAGPPGPEVDLEGIRRDLDQLNDEMRGCGAFVFSGGLASERPTVVRVQQGHVLTSDGPYIESKEHLGGFTIIAARDLEEATGWAARLARATTLPIEVRPFQDAPAA
jgi:hypothetical protein